MTRAGRQPCAQAWVARSVVGAVASEASRYPHEETGGILLGYWRAEDVVLTATIGAGPNARRGSTWLKPDQDWQLRELAEAYAASGRTITYVGDWHTHPGGAPTPSRRDRRTLRAVRRSTMARTRRPLMMIVGPDADSAPRLWCLLSGWRPVVLDPRWF